MKIFLYLIVVIFIFVVYIRYLEHTSVFFPERKLTARPSDFDLPFENIYFETEDHVKLHGWLIQGENRKATLIFLHGNAGNIGDRLEKISLFYRLGLNVFIFDYRGYGQSEGTPSEEGLYQDALAAYDYLYQRTDLNLKNFIAYGASLGGAVAIDLAARRKLAALIADSTFTRAVDMAKRMYFWVPAFLIKTKLDSLAKIRKISTPKLFIHSPEDEVIPIALGLKLYEAAPEPKEFLQVKGRHNYNFTADQGNFEQGIRNFLEKLGLI